MCKEEAEKLARIVRTDMSLTNKEKHVILAVKKIIFKLESGESPLRLSSVPAYKESSRAAGKGTVKVIRAVLRELNVNVSSGYRKIAIINDKSAACD